MISDFWHYGSGLLMEIDPGWFDGVLSDAVPEGEAQFREWVSEVLATTDDERT